MRRWAFNIAVVISLALLAGDLCLIIRGRFYADQYARGVTDIGATVAHGSEWIVHTSSHDVLLFETDFNATAVKPLPINRQGRLTSFSHKQIYVERDDIMPYRLLVALPPAQVHSWGVMEWASRSPANAGISSHWRLVIVPHWAILTLLGILPAVFVVKRRRSRAGIQQGLCRRCGYNLTGNASGVCPECGTVVDPGEITR